MRSNVWVAILLLCCTTTASLSAESLSRSAAAKNARLALEHVRSQYDGEGPGASFLVSHKGRILFSDAIGYANLEFGIPNSENTIYRLGSISKSFTAVAVLNLMERGALDIDAPVSTYAPELPAQMGRVSLRQLMSHRSGLSEHAWKPELRDLVWFPMTTDQIIEIQAGDALEFEPGAGYSYVNFNYVLVAHVIEKVTGKSFVDFANEDMFAANGLTSSFYDVHYDVIPNRAEFYDIRRSPFYASTDESVVVHAADLDLSHVSASGALLSTTLDVNRWARLLLAGALISDEAREMAWTPADLPDGTPTAYGLGFNVRQIAGRRVVWHSGLTPGGQGAFGLAPEEDLFVVILSNGFHLPETSRIMREMIAIMLTGETAVPPGP